jgi:hypothetical protein
MAIRLANETHLRLSLFDGGAQDGTPSYSGTAIVLECRLEDFSDNINVQERDVTARCDAETVMEQIRTTREITFTTRIAVVVGVQLRALVGRYVRAVIEPVDGISGGTETIDDLGISTYTHSSPAQGIQTERITLKKLAV